MHGTTRGRSVFMKYLHALIGASLSEPHTSELNGGIFLIYICMYVCMYVSYVVRPMHAYARRVRAKGV